MKPLFENHPKRDPWLQSVAQRFVIGFQEVEDPETHRWLLLPVGGLILFRHNLTGRSWHHIQDLTRRCRDFLGPQALIAIDQEGGPVERLPSSVFPSAPSPRVLAHPSSTALATTVYREMAAGLADLGITMNCVPTLDVNLNPLNPVIGVRAFGESPETVWRTAQVAMTAMRQAGLIPVGKHFPGHGNGTVDSHEALPELRFTEAELWPFRQAIANGLPAMMVSHGVYPALQAPPYPPASLCPRVVQGLLREELGFDGVIMTDDLAMGAVLGEDPVTVALKALHAGVDMLLYRDSVQPWPVLQAVARALQDGTLDPNAHQASLARITRMKAMIQPQGHTLHPEQADDWAKAALQVLKGQPPQPGERLWVIRPDLTSVPSYAMEAPDGLPGSGYAVGQPWTPITWPSEPVDRLVVVAFNALRDPHQVAGVRRLRAERPHVPLTLISAGMPSDALVLPEADTHVLLGSLRPPALRTLARWLGVIGSPPVAAR